MVTVPAIWGSRPLTGGGAYRLTAEAVRVGSRTHNDEPASPMLAGMGRGPAPEAAFLIPVGVVSPARIPATNVNRGADRHRRYSVSRSISSVTAVTQPQPPQSQPAQPSPQLQLPSMPKQVARGPSRRHRLGLILALLLALTVGAAVWAQDTSVAGTTQRPLPSLVDGGTPTPNVPCGGGVPGHC
jgi:hypothetical protein